MRRCSTRPFQSQAIRTTGQWRRQGGRTRKQRRHRCSITSHLIPRANMVEMACMYSLLSTSPYASPGGRCCGIRYRLVHLAQRAVVRRWDGGTTDSSTLPDDAIDRPVLQAYTHTRARWAVPLVHALATCVVVSLHFPHACVAHGRQWSQDRSHRNPSANIIGPASLIWGCLQMCTQVTSSHHVSIFVQLACIYTLTARSYFQSPVSRALMARMGAQQGERGPLSWQ